jgi:hypothetical protein
MAGPSTFSGYAHSHRTDKGGLLGNFVSELICVATEPDSSHTDDWRKKDPDKSNALAGVKLPMEIGLRRGECSQVPQRYEPMPFR